MLVLATWGRKEADPGGRMGIPCGETEPQERGEHLIIKGRGYQVT
jgi:hypothetical protein